MKKRAENKAQTQETSETDGFDPIQHYAMIQAELTPIEEEYDRKKMAVLTRYGLNRHSWYHLKADAGAAMQQPEIKTQNGTVYRIEKPVFIHKNSTLDHYKYSVTFTPPQEEK